MKHLKIFESILDTFYTQITYNECIELRKRSVEFNAKEISTLKSLANKLDRHLLKDHDYLGHPVIILLTAINQVVIHKLVDEWFLIGEVCIDPNQIIYYKCDQIEGLVSCLENNYGRHLKKFEKFESEDKLYNIVNRDEYRSDDFINFTKSETNVLEKTFKGVVTFSDMIQMRNRFVECIVRKIPDEWYLVRVIVKYGDDTFYKCDQLDGLIQCLRDIQQNIF